MSIIQYIFLLPCNPLSQRNELGVGDTGSAVSGGGVGDGELTEVHADHLGLDLNGGEGLSVVDTNNRANHLGEDEHVSQVGLDHGGLLVGAGGELGLSQLVDENGRLLVEASVEPSSGSGGNELLELVGGDLEQILEVNASVGELLEGSSLSGFCVSWNRGIGRKRVISDHVDHRGHITSDIAMSCITEVVSRLRFLMPRRG
jgi:hypothetical protein